MHCFSSKPLRCIVSTLLFLGAMGSAEFVRAQGDQNGVRQNATSANARPGRNSSAGEVHLLPVQGNIYMLVGAGGNITVQAGEEGILLVDTGVASMSDKVLEAIRPLSKRPL